MAVLPSTYSGGSLQLPTFSATGGGSSSGVGGVASTVQTGAQILSLVSGVIGGETINKTIGNVFANGMNLKCWGSTWSPSRAKKELPNILLEVQQKALSAMEAQTISSFQSKVNAFFDWFYSYRIHERNWLETSAKDCTKDGLKILIAGLDAYKSEVIKGFGVFADSKNWNLTKTTSVIREYYASKRKKTSRISTERFKVTQKASPVISSGTLESVKKTISKGSMGWVIGLLVGGTALSMVWPKNWSFGKKKGSKLFKK